MGRNLRTLREQRKWSRDLLARKSNTAPLTILRAELHGSDPALSTVIAWADALGVTVVDLLEEHDDALGGDAA